MSEIKLVIFDLWRTLIPATIDFVHLKSVLGKAHLSKTEFISRYENATQKKVFKNFEELRKSFLEEFDSQDTELSEEELYEVYFNRFDKINFYPEVKETLIKLKKLGYKLALLSNTESVHSKDLEEKLELKKYFDYLGYSFEIGAIKPDKKAFEAVLNKFKFKPVEVMMVGDSLRSDIAGSKDLGINNCLINRKGVVLDEADVSPDFEIDSLDKIIKIVEGFK